MWEGTIRYITVDAKSGNDKNVKEQYVLENCVSFADVEETLFSKFGELTDFSVEAIKRSKLKEIVNERPFNDDTCKIYVAQIVDRFLDLEKAEIKDIKYSVALFAHDMKEAHQATEQYMKQGLEDMDLVGIKETKFTDVLK